MKGWQCDLQWSFLRSHSRGLCIPANAMARFSINMIICCRLLGMWTSTASRVRLELTWDNSRGGWQHRKHRHTHMAMCVHTQTSGKQKTGIWCNTQEDANSLFEALCTLLVWSFIKCQGRLASSVTKYRGFKTWFIYMEIVMPKWIRP